MAQLLRTLAVSTSRMTVTRSLRRSWTTWRLKKMDRRKLRAAKRAQLLQLELESQLLQCKELEQQHQALLHRQLETRESEAFHNSPDSPLSLPLEGTLSPPEQPEKLGRPLRSLAE
jgi:hypothetical protein